MSFLKELSKYDCPHKEPLHYHHDGCPVCDAPHEPIEGFEDAEHLDGNTADEGWDPREWC